MHIDELRNPSRDYPKSIFLALGLCLAVFIFPTLAILWVVPSHQISFTAGVMQAFNRLLTHFGLAFGVPVIAIALAVGALAGMLAWLDGPSEGLLKIGREQGFLPPYFQRVNRQGHRGAHPWAAEGIVITASALLYAFIPSVSHAYWIFGDGHAGIHDHVRADVHRGDQLRRLATKSRAQLPSARAGPVVPDRSSVGRGRASDRVRPAVPVRPLRPARLARS